MVGTSFTFQVPSFRFGAVVETLKWWRLFSRRICVSDGAAESSGDEVNLASAKVEPFLSVWDKYLSTWDKQLRWG